MAIRNWTKSQAQQSKWRSLQLSQLSLTKYMSSSPNCNSWQNVIVPVLSTAPGPGLRQCCAPNSFMQCTPQGEILSIDLNTFVAQLNGRLPFQFTLLSRLQILRISGGKLTGPIPSEFGQFASLSYLDLSNNLLTGLVPESLGALTENQIPLQTLNLSGNVGLQGPLNPLLKEKVKNLAADPAVLNAASKPTSSNLPSNSTGADIPLAQQPTSGSSSALVVGIVVSLILSILVFGTVFYLQRRKQNTGKKSSDRNSQFWMKPGA